MVKPRVVFNNVVSSIIHNVIIVDLGPAIEMDSTWNSDSQVSAKSSSTLAKTIYTPRLTEPEHHTFIMRCAYS